MPVTALEAVAGDWSRDLGGDRSSGRLPCPVHGLSSSPSSHTGIVSDVPGRLSSGSSLAARGRGDACQRSLRNRPRSGSRLLQSPLPVGEGDWRLEACDRSLTLERLRPADVVQDGNSRFGAVICQRGGFSSFLGSEGRILSDPDPRIIEEAVEVHVVGDSLPVQSPVLRSVDCSPGLYQGVSLGTHSRDQTAPLPGRLVGSLLLGEESQGVDQGAPLALSHPRDCDKREEVGSRALAVCEVPRYDHRYWCRQGLPVSSQSREVPYGSGEILFHAISPSSALAGDSGSPGIAGAVGSSRSSSDALLAVASEDAVVPRVRPSFASGGFAGGSETGSVLVDGEGSPVDGGSIRGTCAGSAPVFGRVFVGVGCSPPRSKRVRGVVRPGEVVAHQSSRNEGPLSGSSGFSRRCSRSPCDRDVRQLPGCGVRQQTGGHGVQVPVFVDQPPSEMDGEFRRPSRCEVSIRRVQRPGRCSQPSRASCGDRVVSPPSGGESTSSCVGQSVNRPVCDLPQREAAPVLLACPGSPGRLRGCVSSSLGRPGSVRVPSLCSGRSGDRPRPAVVTCRDDSGRASLAREGVVRRLAAASDPTTPGSALLGQAASATPLQSVPSRHPRAEPSRVATLKRHYRKSGFSGRAARVLSGVLRESSSRLYQSRWKIICGWCRGRGVAPVNATVPVVVDFLIHLRQDKGLSGSAVKGYCSALNSVLALKGRDLAASREITTLLRSFARSVNPVELHPPAWDISLVLQSLTGAPYEPLRTCEERFLAQKTLFLLALASAKRIGELHALSYRVSHTRDWGEVSFAFVTGFVAKTQDLSSLAPRFEGFTVPALPNARKNRNGRLVCPVRAVKVYLDRTASHRPRCERLFVTAGRSKKEIAKTTVSFLLRKTISRAYELSGTALPVPAPRTRETRGIAPSILFRKNFAVDQVLKAGTWRRHTTFTRHYLRELPISPSTPSTWALWWRHSPWFKPGLAALT